MAEEHQDFVRITNREIYDGLKDVQASNARLENILGTVIKDNSTLGIRVRSLELRFYGVLAGLVAALTALGIGLFRGGPG